MNAPAPLYVRRNLTAESGAAFTEWAAAQGFTNLTPAHELHTTIVYSRAPVSLAPQAGNVAVVGGPRSVVPLGAKGAWVVRFESAELQERWADARAQGASGATWNDDAYLPHVTIGYGGHPADGREVTPFAGDLVFGPEIHEALDPPEDTPLRAAAMRLDGIAAMALNIADAPHPNKMPFSGILTQLDTPSDRAPEGSQGRRVILSTAAAEKALDSLLGMGVNFTESFDGHDVTQKIGVFTAATIEGKAIRVGGFIYARDYPAAAARIKANKDVLGFSYELADIYANDEGDCWGITECVFTGAAILRKDKAAYHQTSIAAAADGELQMTKEEIEAAVASAIGTAFTAGLAPITAELTVLKANQAQTATALAAIQAAASKDEADKTEAAKTAEFEAMKTKIADLQAAADKAKEPERKTMSPQFSAILARANLTMPDGDGKLTVGAVDAALAQQNLSPVQRMQLKNELQRNGAL